VAEDTSDAQKAFDKFLAAAQAIPAAEVLPYRLDPDLALPNVSVGMRVVAEHGAKISEHLPKEDLDALRGLEELALALKFAALRVENEPSETEVTEKIREGWELRALLLPVAKGLAAAALVPSEEVEAIVEGRGTRDMAEDAVALAELFRKHAQKIANKHAATAEQIDRAAVVGTFLLTHLRVKGAPSTATASKAVETRNRLATLLVRRHERLQAVAHYFYGNGWEEKAPPLQSRSVRRQKPIEKKEPEGSGGATGG